MKQFPVRVGTILTILFLSAALYISSIGMWQSLPKHSPAEYGVLGQMILSVSKVNLIDASGSNLPWSGETWLINLVVNPQDAESIIARTGYLSDTIPKEELSSNGKQAQYDLRIKFVPQLQQCIYGPDMTTMDYRAPSKVIYKTFDLGTGISCPHASDWAQFPENYKNDLLNYYDDVAYACAYYCGPGIPKHAYVACDFLTFKRDPGRTGVGKLTLQSLYVKDKIEVSAGQKTASGTTEDKISTGSGNPTALLRYGSSIVGKVDLVGYLSAGTFCPEGSNYYLFNNGSGWKIVPSTMYSNLYSIIRPLDLGQMPASECLHMSSWYDFDACKNKLKQIADMANNYISYINSSSPTIDGKTATRPSAADYSADYYFAIEPDRSVVYSQYRMYLKASWVGILVSSAKPEITSISPTSLSFTGPETKTLSVTVTNKGDRGGIIAKVRCDNGFEVDGMPESTRTTTLDKGDTTTFTYSISYGGDGTSKASGVCTVTVQSSADPRISQSRTISVIFTPKGEYPPNTTVCISRTTYARTDKYGNIIPGSQKQCGEGTYCDDSRGYATCEKEITPPTSGGQSPSEQQSTPSTGTIILAVVAVAMIITLIVALVV